MEHDRAEANVTPAQALGYILRADGAAYVGMALLGLLNGLLSLVSIWVTRRIFALVQGGYSPELFAALAGYAGALLLSAGYSVWYIRYRVQFHTVVEFEGRIRRKLHGKSRRISNEDLETPNAYSFIRQADGARTHLFRYGQLCVETVTALVQAGMITTYVSSFHLWFAAFLPLAVVPPLLELLYRAKLWTRGYEVVERCRREEQEYEKAVVDEVACKETRLTGAAALLLRKWRSSRETRDAVEEKKSRRMLALRLLLAGFACLGDIGGFLVAVLLLCTGRIDLPAFTAGVAAYASLTAILRGLVEEAGAMEQYRRMVQPYFRYWNMPERGGHTEECSFRTCVTLSDVCFAYPNQTGNALEGITLTLKRGETVAIVGENGAGKSTLVNLILGLYRPSSGRVLYDGADASAVEERALHRHQSAVPQNFCRYKMTVGENIALGDFAKEAEGEVERAVARIFPEGGAGSDTCLGKEFGGRELSGGQWQQLACARGFYKDSNFVVLDEPTSAIDPLREKELYDWFRRELDGKTGLIVTHRLGAVKLAERILVLRQGRIVEDGTHEQLLAAGGVYAAFWTAQTAAYEEK